MKAFDLLMKINGYDICKGISWTNSDYKLTILKGTLKQNKYYYRIFNNSNETEYADVILTLVLTKSNIFLRQIGKYNIKNIRL